MESSTRIKDDLTADQVAQLIKGTLSGNNQTIQEATKTLKAYSKSKSSIRTFSYLLVNSKEIHIRQMVTVLLKRNLVNCYGNLSNEQQSEFRGILLDQYIKQLKIPVQKGIATLIGMLLPVVELNNWPQLKTLLDQALKSAPQSPATFILLNNLLYHFKAPLELYQFLLNALTVPKLVEEAMKCLVAVVQSQDVNDFIATKLVQLWEKSNWTEQISLLCFEVLNILCERKVKIPQNVVVWVCEKVIRNKNLSQKFRTAGVDFMFTLAEYNCKSLSKNQRLLKQIVSDVCLTCAEPHRASQDQNPQQLIQDICLWFLETLSVSLKSKKIYPILFEAAVTLINSTDVNQNNTGFLVLAAMTEGCRDRIKKNLQNPIMNVLIPKGVAHEDAIVRGAAINTLCYFSQYLVPDIVQYHSTIIPSMMKYIGDLSPKVAQKALIAIDIFFDSMEEEQIKLYLQIVIPKLCEVLVNDQSTPIMRKASMSAIGGTVTAANTSFQPYVDTIMQMINRILKIPASPQLNSVRAENISVLGRLANTFCKKQYANQKLFFENYILPILETIYGMLVNEKDPEIRQACFAFFYLLANAIENDFQHLFDKIIPQVLKGCQMKMPEKKTKQEFSLDSDSEDEDQYLPSTKATQYDQKAAAIHALGELAKACPFKFAPYFEQSYKILQENYQFFYEAVRNQVSTCYLNLTLGLVKSQAGGIIPKYKKGLPCSDRYPEHIEKFFKTQLIPKFIFIMTEDQSSKVSSIAIENLDELIKQIGPVVIDQSLDPITEAIKRLLQQSEGNVVGDSDDQEQQQPQQQDDTDIYLFEPICDLIPRIAEVLLVGSEPILFQLHPYMARFLQERDDINDNIQMAGCISQLFKHVPALVQKHHQQYFKSLIELIKLQDTDLNRNVAYCFAEMFDKCPKVMIKYLQQALLALKAIFEHPNSSEACKDNAIGALCRIIYSVNPQIPYETTIQNILSRMPFQGDQQQQPSAIKAILFLNETKSTLIQPHTEKIVKVFQNDLENPKKYYLTEQLIVRMKQFLIGRV